LGGSPSVSTVNCSLPPTLTVATACALTVLGVGRVSVTLHCPRASVVQARGAGICMGSPLLNTVKVKVTFSPGAALHVPAPVCAWSVAEKVCECFAGRRTGSARRIRASNHLAVAGGEFPCAPSVVIVNGADRATESVEEAVAVTVPGVVDVIVTAHSPAALVMHCSGPGVTGLAPSVGAELIVTVSPEAGMKEPVPGSFSSLAVNVWAVPARPAFVSAAAIDILASIPVVIAGSEFARFPSLFSVSVLPLTDRVVCAEARVTPGTAELSSTWQLPLPSATVHGFGEVITPGPESIVNQMLVPLGAGCEPEPSQTFTWPLSARDPRAWTAA